MLFQKNKNGLLLLLLHWTALPASLQQSCKPTATCTLPQARAPTKSLQQRSSVQTWIFFLDFPTVLTVYCSYNLFQPDKDIYTNRSDITMGTQYNSQRWGWEWGCGWGSGGGCSTTLRTQQSSVVTAGALWSFICSANLIWWCHQPSVIHLLMVLPLAMPFTWSIAFFSSAFSIFTCTRSCSNS